jgi:hypothetical protein
MKAVAMPAVVATVLTLAAVMPAVMRQPDAVSRP